MVRGFFFCPSLCETRFLERTRSSSSSASFLLLSSQMPRPVAKSKPCEQNPWSNANHKASQFTQSKALGKSKLLRLERCKEHVTHQTGRPKKCPAVTTSEPMFFGSSPSIAHYVRKTRHKFGFRMVAEMLPKMVNISWRPPRSSYPGGHAHELQPERACTSHRNIPNIQHFDERRHRRHRQWRASGGVQSAEQAKRQRILHLRRTRNIYALARSLALEAPQSRRGNPM